MISPTQTVITHAGVRMVIEYDIRCGPRVVEWSVVDHEALGEHYAAHIDDYAVADLYREACDGGGE